MLRVKVGRWADLRRDSAVRQLEQGPKASGVYAKPTAAGDRDRAARRPRATSQRELGPGGGLVAATRLGGEAPTWIVTGTDEVGLAAAAAQLQETALENRFAIAVEDGRPTALPLLAAAGDAVIYLAAREPAARDARGRRVGAGAWRSRSSRCRSTTRSCSPCCSRSCSRRRRARASAAARWRSRSPSRRRSRS